jgi:predicted nuclease of predicted toxin-antitoxin system
VHFVIDAQLPPALTRWIAAQGHDAVHVGDIGLLRADDREIWEYAVRSAAVIVTKDEDFAARRFVELSGPAVVWIRRGNVTNRDLLEWFAPVFPRTLHELERGTRVVEIM